MTIEKTHLQTSIMMVIITQINNFEFQKINKLQYLLKIKIMITMLHGYYSSYDAVKL